MAIISVSFSFPIVFVTLDTETEVDYTVYTSNENRFAYMLCWKKPNSVVTRTSTQELTTSLRSQEMNEYNQDWDTQSKGLGKMEKELTFNLKKPLFL